MVDWLVKRLVPNDEIASDAEARNVCGRKASLVGICCNVVLALGKGAVGVASGSVGIAADATNNLADASSNVVSLLGFKLASKPPDAEHPYGHGRYEYLAALFVAVGIILVGVELVRDSTTRIARPAPVDAGPTALAVLVVSIVVKLWMARFNARLGARIGSSVLAAASADSLNDVIATSAVLTTTLITLVSGINLDGWAGLGIGVFIVWSGIGLVRDTVDTLLGRGPSPELIERIRSRIVNTPGVRGLHGLMVHDYGPGRLFASAHVEVDPNGSVVASHELVDAIEHELWDHERIVMTLHVDPYERGDGSITDRAATTETIDPHTRAGSAIAGELASETAGGKADDNGGINGTSGARTKAKGRSIMGYKAKQMIVVRRDLKMRKGKIAAQAGHACVEATLMALAREGRLSDVRVTPTEDWVYLDDSDGDAPTPLSSWFDAGVAKVCVYVDGEDALLELAVRGRELGFLCALVRDAGLTEFGGETTYTCLAFEPLYPEQIDPLTGELPLY